MNPRESAQFERLYWLQQAELAERFACTDAEDGFTRSATARLKQARRLRRRAKRVRIPRG